MKKVCEQCGQEFDWTVKKCPICSKKLKTRYTEEELQEMKKQNDDMVAINTMMPM